MADNSSTFIKLGIIGAVGYFAYTQGWLSFLGIGGSAPAPTPTPTPTPAPNPNAIQGANTIDGVFTKMVAAAPSGSHGVDEWNSYLQTAMQGVKSGWVAPDPMPIFTAAVQGFSRDQQLSSGQYWGVMAPWLKTNAGLSGYGRNGLGMYHDTFSGLAAIASHYRRYV